VSASEATTSGERRLPRAHWLAVVVVILCSLNAARGGLAGVVFALFTAMFAWQGTVWWCFYRRQRDGKNVWEHRYDNGGQS
jgi:hypothetical protein